MTFLVNDPLTFAADSLRGFVAAHADLVQPVHGGVVRATTSPEGEVAVVVGGGSGHYPAFAGWVGPGIAHGAVCGNIFASPSASQVISVTRSADNGAGTLLLFGNYAGDCLQFGQGAKALAEEGIDARIVTISDDVASGNPDKHRERRGIAGDLIVAKVAGAAAARGDNLDQVEALAWRSNDLTRSLGIAFSGPTLPGATEPLFEVADGTYELGLGIHGEPGLSSHQLVGATEVAQRLVSGVLTEEPERGTDGYDGRVAVIVNGLGATKYEELFVLYGDIAELLEQAGLTIVAPVVDEAVTSLDMAGVSLTVCFLDEELEELWTAPAYTPAFTRGQVDGAALGGARREVKDDDAAQITPGAEPSVAQARRVTELLDLVARTCKANAESLGQLDSIAGDGDHGQGMVLGATAAASAAHTALEAKAGAATLLTLAGQAWAEGAGGTSGALWGRALETIAARLSDETQTDAGAVVQAVAAGARAVAEFGGAEVGDKTMVDATEPFAQAMSEAGTDLAAAFRDAAEIATQAAASTADMAARKGRAKTHGDASLGHPDPGAVSFSQIVTAVAQELATRS